MNVIEFKQLYDKKWDVFQDLFDNPSDYNCEDAKKIIEDFCKFINSEVVLVNYNIIQKEKKIWKH